MPEMQLLQSTLKHSWYNYVLTLLTGKGGWGWHWKWSSFKLRQVTHQCMIELCPFTTQNLLISVKVSCTTLRSTLLRVSLITREVRERFQYDRILCGIRNIINICGDSYRSPDPFTLYAMASSALDFNGGYIVDYVVSLHLGTLLWHFRGVISILQG